MGVNPNSAVFYRRGSELLRASGYAEEGILVEIFEEINWNDES